MAVIKNKLPTESQKPKPAKSCSPSLQAFTAAVLVLPGLMQSPAFAADDDEVDFQYSHYQEGKRDANIEGMYNPIVTGITTAIKGRVPNYRNPIEVDSIHGSGKISLTDRIKFGFNYIEDTWSGATPLASAPSSTFFIGEMLDANRHPILKSGATPFPLYADNKGNVLTRDQLHHGLSYQKDHTVHIMSYASPETRKQGDFKLGYEWDDAAATLGGGISTEPDFESRFANLGGRMDFNQKQTTVNLGLSYTNSAVGAVQLFEGGSGVKNLGIRQDWAPYLGLTQVLNKNALLELGMGYTRSTGYMANPYKLSVFYYPIAHNDPFYIADHTNQNLHLGSDINILNGKSFEERRPELRNQWNWSARWVQYVQPLEAALHFDYQFFHDDWGINAHTLAADWAQSLGAGWSITPNVRYYSQDAANFYQPYFITSAPYDPQSKSKISNYTIKLPTSFSSDQRLSGYGAISGGVTVAKQFSKGVSLETGIEYYSHQGGLKLGGGGEGSFADVNYWVANAALKVNLSTLDHGISGGDQQHAQHHHHDLIPAGVMFGHSLNKAGDVMVGYRYQRDWQSDGMLHGNRKVSDAQTIANGCPDNVAGCSMLPTEMGMNMHMLEVMAAPTNWLTLMLMPQFMNMDMTMSMYQLAGVPVVSGHNHGGSTAMNHNQNTGGIGDTGLYAMVNLFDSPRHHLHLAVGGTAPTGDVGIKLKMDPKTNLDGAYTHYGMQLGSGTWDFKPSLTYIGKAEDWSWGTQIGGTKRLQYSNESGYALGDIFNTSVWGGYDLTHWLNASIRAVYTWQGRIKGQYPSDWRYLQHPPSPYTQCIRTNFPSEAEYNTCVSAILLENRQAIARIDAQARPSLLDAPSNYGSHTLDVGFGLNVNIPNGTFAGHSLKFEWLQPTYTHVNGYQLDRSGALTFTWGVGF